jgi:hypothetical protein
MLLDVEDQFPPRERSTSRRSHEPEAALPAVGSASASRTAGAKATSAKYCDALKIAEAVPRSAVGNHAATMRPLPGKTGDCASPESSRRQKMALKIHCRGQVAREPDQHAQTVQQTMLMP